MEEAISKNKVTGRVVAGYAQNGIWVIGYMNDWKITNFFPSIDQPY